MAEFVRNDKLFYLRFTILDPKNNPVNLTNCEVKFKMKSQKNSELQVNDLCEIVNEDAGLCKYLVKENDFNKAGLFNAELKLNYDTGKTITAILNPIKIIEDL